MRCPRHGYEYEFPFGACPHCEANESAALARKAIESAEREARERRIRDEESEQERRYEAEGRAVDREVQAQRDERERENAEAREWADRQERADERARERAREAVRGLVRSSERKLNERDYRGALRDAERALSEDKNLHDAIEAAYEATEGLNNIIRTSSLRTAPPNEYAGRMVKLHILGLQRGSPSIYDINNTDKLIIATAKYGAAGEQILLHLIKEYRGGSERIQAILSKIDRSDLYDIWKRSDEERERTRQENEAVAARAAKIRTTSKVIEAFAQAHEAAILKVMFDYAVTRQDLELQVYTGNSIEDDGNHQYRWWALLKKRKDSPDSVNGKDRRLDAAGVRIRADANGQLTDVEGYVGGERGDELSEPKVLASGLCRAASIDPSKMRCPKSGILDYDERSSVLVPNTTLNELIETADKARKSKAREEDEFKKQQIGPRKQYALLLLVSGVATIWVCFFDGYKILVLVPIWGLWSTFMDGPDFMPPGSGGKGASMFVQFIWLLGWLATFIPLLAFIYFILTH